MNTRQWRRAAHAVAPLMVGVLAACGGDDGPSDGGVVPLTVPKVASCSTGDTPETALQGQVPAALRASGFGGFNCNLSKLGQYQGEGGNWSHATFTDGAGHTCGYHSTGSPVTAAGVSTGRKQPGVPVIDITDPSKPVRTASLTTTSMLDPWESLRVNARRQILVADNGANGAGGPEIDIYDLSGDCRSPQLLAIGRGRNRHRRRQRGHADPAHPSATRGIIAPDGLTYYMGEHLATRQLHTPSTSRTRLETEGCSSYLCVEISIGLTSHARTAFRSVQRRQPHVYAVVARAFLLATDVADRSQRVACQQRLRRARHLRRCRQRVPNAQIKLVSHHTLQGRLGLRSTRYRSRSAASLIIVQGRRRRGGRPRRRDQPIGRDERPARPGFRLSRSRESTT